MDALVVMLVAFVGYIPAYRAFRVVVEGALRFAATRNGTPTPAADAAK